MSKNNHDIQLGRRVNPMAKFSFWTGLLSIPASFFLLGFPIGLVAVITGRGVIKRNRENLGDDVDWGKAKLGVYAAIVGILFSLVWGAVLLISAIFQGISKLFS